MTRLEKKLFDFGKQKHAAYLLNNCEEISKYIAVKYKHSGSEMSMAIKKMDKPKINMPEVPEYTSSRVDIFIR